MSSVCSNKRIYKSLPILSVIASFVSFWIQNLDWKVYSSLPWPENCFQFEARNINWSEINDKKKIPIIINCPVHCSYQPIIYVSVKHSRCKPHIYNNFIATVAHRPRISIIMHQRSYRIAQQKGRYQHNDALTLNPSAASPEMSFCHTARTSTTCSFTNKKL